MRIVHVADANHKYLGLRTYGMFAKLHNGFVRNGHDVYHFSDREVARASNPLGTRKLGVSACNRKLIKVCQNFEPDVMVLAHADIIRPDTILKIRRDLPDILVFQYNVDGLFIPSNVQNLLSKSDCVDHTFTTTAGASLRQVAGFRSGVSFFPNAVDISIDACRNHENDHLETDVFFAGSANQWADADDLRLIAPSVIQEHFPQLKCEFYGNKNKIFGAKFKAALCRTKMGLNFSLRPTDMESGEDSPLYLYSSDRIGLYMGNGLLTFTSKVSNLTDLYGSDRIVEVEDSSDLIDKIRYYSNNDEERKRVAKCGYDFVHNECNERLVTQYMIETASGLNLSHKYVWPTEVYKKL
ncbi:MAG: glycosyltransferase family 1 protein [Gammaproteobacteria bacterium]|nr:glycosyltransferase family 1 protein [Gammaproteobacteria bacterium]